MFIGTSQAMLDRDFLKKMDNYTQREVFAKLISLDWDERAIAEITGNIVSGNISVDGSSSTRRTCSLSLVTDNQNADLNDIYWGLNTKFAVLIGLKNYIDNIHDDIIWFQQGVFIITSYTSTANTSGTTVSIQGKDKMCMLDGTIGGTLFADHVFSEVEVINNDGTTSKELVTIQDLVKNAVHTYALESYENIVITDLDDCAVELLDYKVADKGMFIYDISIDPSFKYYTSQMVFENSPLAERFIESAPKKEGSSELDPDYYIPYAQFELDGAYYRIVKFVQYGDTAGYRETDLTYAGTLIVNAGNPVSQALDACVNMLGEFEYFYDIYGRFIFQRKRIYHNIPWTSAVTNEGESTYYDSLNSTQSQYEFVNGFLINSFANKPLLSNIRNDFVVWGTTDTDAPIHLRYAIASKPDSYISLSTGMTYYTEDNWRFKEIGKKVYFEPGRNEGFICQDIILDEDYFIQVLQEELRTTDVDGYYSFHYIYSEERGHRWQYFLPDGRSIYTERFNFSVPEKYIGYTITLTVNTSALTFDSNYFQVVDWREILYRMALDSSRSAAYIEQLTLAMNREPMYYPYKIGFQDLVPSECYYYDATEKKWQHPLLEEVEDSEIKSIKELQKKGSLIFGIPTEETKDNFMSSTHIELIEQWQNTWNTGYDYCYADLLAFWRLIYDNRPTSEIENDKSLTDSEIAERIKRHAEWEANYWWHPDIIYCQVTFDDEGHAQPHTLYFKDPGLLYFWIDFIGENSELEKYRMDLIGRRPKVINDKDVKAIFFRDTPQVLFVDPTDVQPQESTLNYVKLNLVGGLLNYFHLSGQGKSAKEVLDNMVYQYTYYQETITINSLPIYYFEPNVRISVSDETSGIQGEYFVKSFSYSFSHDGTMSITATKAEDRIL